MRCPLRTYYAAFFNTETGTTYIIDEYGPTTACGVTDDGEGFVGIGSSMCTSSIVVDVETGIKARQPLRNGCTILSVSMFLTAVSNCAVQARR